MNVGDRVDMPTSSTGRPRGTNMRVVAVLPDDRVVVERSDKKRWRYVVPISDLVAHRR